MIKTGAVYFLYRFFNDNPEATIEEGYDVYKQALEMEKEQIIDAYKEGCSDWISNDKIRGIQYYNETYGSND